MKICLAVIALLFSVTQGAPDFLPPQANVPQDVRDRFKKRAALRNSYEPKFKKLRRGAKFFEIDGIKIDIDDLVPVDNLFAPGAKIIIDKKEQEPKVYLYRSQSYPGVKVLLDNDKSIMKASRKRQNGSEVELVPVYGDTFAEFDDEDIDFSQLDDFEMVSVRIWRECA